MPNFSKESSKTGSKYVGNQADPGGDIFGQLMSRFLEMADKANAQGDNLLSGPGGLIEQLGAPTRTAEDADILGRLRDQQLAGGWDTFRADDLASKWKDAGETGLYSQADDSASKNWAQLFRNEGDTESKTNSMITDLVDKMGISEEDARGMAMDLANNPGRYDEVLAKFATGPGKYDDQLGAAYGGLLNKPGFSDAEKTALEQEGMLTARSAADSLRERASRAASATGNEGSQMAALASIGRDTTRGLGEQARQNVLAEASQRRADISQGGEGISNLQKMIDSRMSAMEGINAQDTQRRIAGTQAMGEMAGLEAGRRTAGTAQSGQMAGLELSRMTDAAKAASARAENLAARKYQGMQGAGAQEEAMAAGKRAGLSTQAGFQSSLADREKARIDQKAGVQNALAQQGFGATGAVGGIAATPTEGFGKMTGGGFSL